MSLSRFTSVRLVGMGRENAMSAEQADVCLKPPTACRVHLIKANRSPRDDPGLSKALLLCNVQGHACQCCRVRRM